MPASLRAFETAKVALLSAGHGIHDMYPAFLAPLLPLLQQKLALSNTLAGSLAAFMRSSSLVQPFIGYLADRTNVRWFVVLAPGITAVCMSLLGATPSYFLLPPLLILTGLSHASYHAPAPAMIAHVSGDRVGTGMSFFMTGGELGRAAGPLLIVLTIQWFGLEASYLAAIPGLVMSVVMARLVGPIRRPGGGDEAAPLRPRLIERRRPLSLLLALVATRALLVGSVTVFTPAYLITRGMTLRQAAAGYALFELAGAAGAMAGGTLSDRLGRRRTLILCQALAGPFFLAMVTGSTESIFPWLAVSGFVVFSATPVALTLLQDLLPEARSTASGLYFSLNYVATGLAAVLFGTLADGMGISSAYGLLGVVPLLTLPFAVLLPAPIQGKT